MYNGLQFDEVKEIISNYCSFSLSAQLIKDLKPTNNKLFLKQEIARLNEALALTISYGTMPFNGIKDLSNEIEIARRNGILNCRQLLDVASQSNTIESVNKYIREAEKEKENIKDLTDSLENCLSTSNAILKCISTSATLYDNASGLLSEIRRKIKTTNSNITNKLQNFMNANAAYLQDNIIAQRNDRSVVLIKNSYKNTVEGLQYGLSASGAATYIEPVALVSLNNQLADLLAQEKSEIERILFSLSQKVKYDADILSANLQTLKLLDSYFARARWAKENNGVIGKISDGELILKQARHPLIEANKVVANDYNMVNGIKTILITGPNTGGKTISLKVIGLFSLMFLSGLPLLAQQAFIPIFDHIYYDIGDNQSISEELSTFGYHIKNIANICHKATSNSLVILDELGSSTDPSEGQALACAILEYLNNKDIYVVATTHFAALKSYGQSNQRILVSSVEFDQINLKPTYKYVENSIGQSNAIEIAKRYNLRDEIITRTLELKTQQQTKSDIILEEIAKELNEINHRNNQLIKEQEEIEKLKQDLLQQREAIQKQKQDIIDQANQKAQEIVLQAKEETQEIIDELKEKQSINIKEIAQVKNRINQLNDYEDEEEQNEDFRIGDYVRITLTNQCGEIIELKKDKAIILCGTVKISASTSNIVKTKKMVKKENKPSMQYNTVSTYTSELNVIGLTALEALEEVDKYLDTALLHNAPFVRIVHGVGSGVLRKAIWNKLAKLKYIEKYECAAANQGGAGATIVTFKGKDA